MHRTFLLKSLLASLVVVVGVTGNALAVPYASGIRNTAGSTWEFVLNQPASGVTVMRDGGSPLSLGALAAGRYTFDMTGHSTFDIKVSNTAATAWTWVNNTPTLWDDFERPTGMAVNSNPSNLAYFGTIYVDADRARTTATGRATGDGVYALSADIKGINANDYSVVADDHADTSKAATLNWNVAATSSPWRLALDNGGNLIVSDWSDAAGGMKWANPGLTDGGPLLNTQGGPQFGIPHPTIPNAYMHGSIVSKPYVQGTLGTNLVVSGVDEDLESSFGAGDGDNLWTWNIGSAPGDHIGSTNLPTLVVDGSALVNGANSGTDSAGTPWFENEGGHFVDATYSPAKNRWYMSSATTYGEEKSALLVVDTSGGTPVVKWSSKQFSIDHGLDGMPDSAIAESAGINDIFREAWAMKLSPDGTKLYVGLSKAHNEADDVNPYVGPASAHVPGAILVIPLDANGLPDIQINDNGTPGNTADDYITNIQSFYLPADGLASDGNLDRVNIDVDAAGNVYVTDNISEKLRVFSPGGNTLATTSSNGTFNLSALAAGLLGDFNNDGKVDARDYITWRKNSANGSLPNDNGLATQAARYSLWRSSFGTSGSGSGSLGGGAVPEPSTIGLAVIGMLSVLARRRRRIG
jgi:hypothetical protein